MKSYDRILRAVYAQPWAILPEKLEAIVGFLELLAAGVPATADLRANIHEKSVEAAARAQANTTGAGSIAVLSLFGLISHRANMMGDISGPRGTSTEKFGAQFRAALQDPNISAIVIDCDSPGGTIDGVPELAAEILDARGKKPIVAVANALMASAAYWICSAASEVVASPSAQVGSIGVYYAHEDNSKALETDGVKVTLVSAGKYKVEGNPYEPLSAEAMQALQAKVDDFYGMFTRSVAKSRGVKADDVRNGFGEGRVMTAQHAVKAGLADRVATLDEVLAGLGAKRAAAGAARAESTSEVHAEDNTAAVETERRRRDLKFAEA
jgi:signal peptide peptidase SppA